jgi:catechol 2,3-dioxygenase-like lactoylglutathione lyase family enzyme
MARIRYLAFLCSDASKVAEFYVRYFDMKELGRSPSNDITLSDGFMNLTFFHWRPQLGEPRMEAGLHHVGVEVDNLEAVKERYLRSHPNGLIIPEEGDLQHGKIRIFDPECTPVSLSDEGFGIPAPTERLPRMRHVAYNALYPGLIGDFFMDVLGFREVRSTELWRRRGRTNRFLGDGHSNLAIHPFYNDNLGHEARYGINHFGFLVGELDNLVEDLKKVVPIAARPDRPYEDYRAQDPEGNRIDISYSKGFETDIDKWDMTPAAVRRTRKQEA